MAAEKVILVEKSGCLSFGNHILEKKVKVEDFPFKGDLLKVKTYYEITKLEKNGSFLYESVPGTTVNMFEETEDGMRFCVAGKEDAQLTVGLAAQTKYEVVLDGESIGVMETNLSGKLSVSVEFGQAEAVQVEIKKA